MRYYCEDCHRVMDELDMDRECIGEYWGVPAYIDYGICPLCGSTEVGDCIEDCEECEYAEVCEDAEGR